LYVLKNQQNIVFNKISQFYGLKNDKGYSQLIN